MPCARAMLTFAPRCAQCAAILRAEEPVQQRNHCRGNHEQQQNRVVKRKIAHVAQGHQQVILIRIHRRVRLVAHDAKVDGIERKLRQNAR